MKTPGILLSAFFLAVALTMCLHDMDDNGTRTDGTAFTGWLELPSITDSSLMFLSHDMTMAGRTERNYSYLWDTAAMVARWVAYPLNAGLMEGDSKRTNAWGYDPLLPASLQPMLYKGFADYADERLDRGHQIPSYDRRTHDANCQTFYFTNMTPQDNGLNTGLWARLEDQVRDWAMTFDTLYVVSGCIVRGSVRTAYDNEGKAVIVPSAYYKALLGYTAPGSYTAVGLFFDHEDYPYDFRDGMITIDELEKKTGEDFFVNLPSVIGGGASREVESSIDSCWLK